MKARIKGTGEIVDLAQEVIGHKSERFQWFQLELIPEPYDEFFDWQSFRAEAAKDILCSLILDDRVPITKEQVTNSIWLADELIKQLKEKEEK